MNIDYTKLKKAMSTFTIDDIEKGMMQYCLACYEKDFSMYKGAGADTVATIMKDSGAPADLEFIVDFFEALLEKENIDVNGIVFTPKYISDYIVSSVLYNKLLQNIKIIDPGCGCGIFLISAAEYILANSNLKIDDIIENNIFGIDIDTDNSRRCILALRLLSAKYGGNYINVKPNVACCDSLNCSWSKLFSVKTFSCVIGNPPYVNPHDMDRKTANFLKKNFKTTKSGVFNIFYAFIEYAAKFLDMDGALGYIVPNNFLSIKSAYDLRVFLQEQFFVSKIVDFGENMVFRPVRTYNCIILLSPRQSEIIEYAVMPKVSNIAAELKKIRFGKMPASGLDKNGWNLVSSITRRNINKIESQEVPIKGFIRTGIATLKDGVYLIDRDDNGYYKEVNGERYDIEEEIVKPIYKIPELRSFNSIEEAKRYIIFPYVRAEAGYILISELVLQSEYPMTYKYLCRQRKSLDSRDKGKGATQGWYAYGRTQGLNKYGKKLLFPTFSNKPKFIFINNEDTLFCNGYAVFENDVYDLRLLQKVLNSSLMDYYIKNTSYSIEGGYYCYQKKYVEKFSLPKFSQKDIDFLLRANEDEANAYLCALYNLDVEGELIR